MESLWRLQRYRRQAWGCHFPHPFVVYLYFFSYPRLASYHLYDTCILDES